MYVGDRAMQRAIAEDTGWSEGMVNSAVASIICRHARSASC